MHLICSSAKSQKKTVKLKMNRKLEDSMRFFLIIVVFVQQNEFKLKKTSIGFGF